MPIKKIDEKLICDCGGSNFTQAIPTTKKGVPSKKIINMKCTGCDETVSTAELERNRFQVHVSRMVNGKPVRGWTYAFLNKEEANEFNNFIAGYIDPETGQVSEEALNAVGDFNGKLIHKYE